MLGIRNRGTIGTLALLLCCLPLTASANAMITPLMLGTVFHVLYGNVIVGCLEGGLLAALWRVKWWQAILTMIVANYFSSLAGIVLSSALTPTPDLYTLWHCQWTMVAWAYVLTLLLEWPFIAFVLRRKERWVAKSIRASLALQTLTYAILIGWYANFSRYSLYKDTKIVTLEELELPPGLRLYFIADADGEVYQRELGSRLDIPLSRLGSTCVLDGLTLQEREDGGWDLVASQGRGKVPIGLDVAQNVPVPDESSYVDDPIPMLGSAKGSEWRFGCARWDDAALSGSREGPLAERVDLVCQLPCAFWTFGNATHLPGDSIVFQLGARQICVLDVNQRKVALLAYGRSPVVVVPKTAREAPQP